MPGNSWFPYSRTACPRTRPGSPEQQQHGFYFDPTHVTVQSEDYFEEVSPEFLDQVANLVAHPDRKAVVVGSQLSETPFFLVASDRLSAFELLLETMPGLPIEKGALLEIRRWATANDTPSLRDTIGKKRSSDEAETSHAKRPRIMDSAGDDERGNAQRDESDDDYQDDGDQHNGHREEPSGSESSQDIDRSSTISSSSSIDRRPSTFGVNRTRQAERQAKGRIMRMDQVTLDALRTVFGSFDARTFQLNADKRPVPFTVVELWLNTARNIAAEGGRESLGEFLRKGQGAFEDGTRDDLANDPEMKGLVLAVREVVGARVNVHQSFVRYRMSILIVLRYYERVLQRTRESMAPRARVGAAVKRTNTNVAKVMKKELGGAATTGQLERAKLNLAKILRNSRRWNLLAQQCGFGVLFIASYEDLADRFIEKTLKTQAEVTKFGELLKLLYPGLIKDGERFWVAINGNGALEKEDINELDLGSERAQSAMVELIAKLEKNLPQQVE